MNPPPTKQPTWEELLLLRATWSKCAKTVIWTNGCFDILHVGHLRSLQAARALGDILVVGLNSDRSVRELKGPDRPINSEGDRAELIAGFHCVDFVTVFDELTPELALSKLKPDVHCKGADYAPPHGKPIPERELVEAYGGRVAFLPIIEGHSTTNAISKMSQRK